jgi:branched-chain amino acid transport system ATP-binding protein
VQGEPAAAAAGGRRRAVGGADLHAVSQPARALHSQGTKLSGGEQQMLAIGRILRTGARLLLLDEPTEGLAPVIVQQIGKIIARLKQQGFTILLVEQNFRFAQKVADRHYIVEHGRVVDMIPGAELESNLGRVHEYLGV